MPISSHLPLLIVFVLATALAAIILSLSQFLGPRRPSAVKSAPFESGNVALPAVAQSYNVRFYLVAILFLVFDIEAVFIYPWAITFRERMQAGSEAQWFGLLAMASFMSTLLVGLAYAWRKGALDWTHKTAP